MKCSNNFKIIFIYLLIFQHSHFKYLVLIKKTTSLNKKYLRITLKHIYQYQKVPSEFLFHKKKNKYDTGFKLILSTICFQIKNHLIYF